MQMIHPRPLVHGKSGALVAMLLVASFSWGCAPAPRPSIKPGSSAVGATASIRIHATGIPNPTDGDELPDGSLIIGGRDGRRGVTLRLGNDALSGVWVVLAKRQETSRPGRVEDPGALRPGDEVAIGEQPLRRRGLVQPPVERVDEVERDGAIIRVRAEEAAVARSGIATPSAGAPVEASSGARPDERRGPARHAVRSTAVGYLTLSKEVHVGAKVAKGALVASVDVLGIAAEVRADQGGIIAVLKVATGDPVEYGQELFVLEAVGEAARTDVVRTDANRGAGA